MAPQPPIIAEIIAYQKRATMLNGHGLDPVRAREAARQMRQIASATDRDPNMTISRRIARQEFGEPVTPDQCPVEHEMMFNAFFPIWLKMRDSGLKVTAWPAFATARLGQTGAIAWQDIEGNSAILFNPLSLEMANFLGKTLGPIMQVIQEEEDEQTTPQSERDVVISQDQSMQRMAAGLIEILETGRPGPVGGGQLDDDARAFEIGAIAGSILAFVISHEIAHIVGEHFNPMRKTPGTGPDLDDILETIIVPYDRIALAETWRLQEEEIEADLLGMMMAIASQGVIHGAVGALAWLMMMDIVEYTVSQLRFERRALRVSADAIRAHSLLSGQVHPPPIVRTRSVFGMVIKPILTPRPDASPERKNNANRIRRRFKVVSTAMGMMKGSVHQILCRPAPPRLAALWMERPPGSLYPTWSPIDPNMLTGTNTN